MQKQELEARQKAVETRFNELTQQKEDLTNELIRLQGAHQILGDLIINYNKEESPQDGVKPRKSKKPAA